MAYTPASRTADGLSLPSGGRPPWRIVHSASGYAAPRAFASADRAEFCTAHRVGTAVRRGSWCPQHAALWCVSAVRRRPTACGRYYSCCFSIRDRAAAQRGSWFRCDVYLVSPPSGRRRSGHGGCQACGVVVPAGAGLMASAPCGPAQLEGGAGPADEAGFPVASQPVDAGGLGGRQLDRGDAGRAGPAAEVRQRRGPSPELQVSTIGGRLAGGRPGGGRGRQDCGSGERGLDRGGSRRCAAGRGRSARCAC